MCLLEFTPICPIDAETRQSLHLNLQEYKHDITFLYDETKTEIENCEEFQLCKELMMKDKVIEPHLNNVVGTADFKQRFETENLLQILTEITIRNLGSFTFNQKAFDNIYTQFETFFHSNEIERSICTFLENFNSTEKEIEIENGLCILELPSWRILNLWFGMPSDFRRIFTETLSRTKFVFRIAQKEPKIIGNNPPSMRSSKPQRDSDISTQLISALRTFKRGSIYLGSVTEGFLISDLLFGGFRSPFAIPAEIMHFRQSYTLLKDEIPSFIGYWKSFKKPYSDRIFKIAIRRFNYSYFKDSNLHDKILDYFIAFESLFLDDHQELSYKLAIRLSFFLGKDESERSEIFKLIKKAYSLRSKIVHGEDITKELKKLEKKYNMGLYEFIELLQEYLRKSIQKLVKLNHIPNWDNMILKKQIDIQEESL